MSEMRANEYLSALSEQGLYVVVDWPDDNEPCTVYAREEPENGRHTDELEEELHNSANPVAVGAGASYVEALGDLYRKVNH